jgi:hypothetical protein
MTGKVVIENLEKEAILRHLLATMVCSAFWQGLFKKLRML